MGPMSLCVGSYLPFTVNCFLNGHSYVAQELRRAGVRFRMEDNEIVACADPDRLTAVADRLDERILQQPASYWASRLAPRFSPRERAACQLEYQWSVAQIEFARDVIFHRRARLHALFQRAVEIGVALGGATHPRARWPPLHRCPARRGAALLRGPFLLVFIGVCARRRCLFGSFCGGQA